MNDLESQLSLLNAQYKTSLEQSQELSIQQLDSTSKIQDLSMENSQLKSKIVVLVEEIQRIDLARQVAEHHRVFYST